MNKILSLLLVLISTCSVVYAEDMRLDTPTPCANLTYSLRVGSTDSQTNGDVTNLQTFLQDEGFLSSDPTGYFGQMTAKAVKKFQTRYGISPVGSVGTVTRKKINSLSCDVVTNTTLDTNTYATGSVGGLSLLQSNTMIQLTPPITVTFPTATTTLKMGQTYNIKWNTDEGSNITYTVHLVGGTTDIVLGKALSGSGSLPWYVPASLTPGSIYKVLIESDTGSKIVSSNFNLVPPDQNVPVIKSLSSTQGRSGDSVVVYGSNFSSRVTLSVIQFLKGDKVLGYIDPSVKNPYAVSIDGTQIIFTLDPSFTSNLEAGIYQMRVANPFGDGYAFSNVINFTLAK